MIFRRIFILLFFLVKVEFDKFIELDVIEWCIELLEWCFFMVVVFKGNGKVRICVDFMKFNEVVKRERIMFFIVDYIIVLMGGVKVFFKLDVNVGFY